MKDWATIVRVDITDDDNLGLEIRMSHKMIIKQREL